MDKLRFAVIGVGRMGQHHARILAGNPQVDLVAVVDAAVADGVDFSLLKPAVSKLVNLLSTALAAMRHVPEPGERLFASLMAENAGLLAVLERGKALARSLNDATTARVKEGTLAAAAGLKALVTELGAIDIHYIKKENVLFPFFEARWPRYRCVRLMWEIQDDARRGLRELAALLEPSSWTATGSFAPGPDIAAVNKALGRLYFDLNANVTREECALFPVMAPLIGKADGERLFMEMAEFGYCFLDPAAIGRFSVPPTGTEQGLSDPGGSAMGSEHGGETGLGTEHGAVGSAMGTEHGGGTGFTGRTGSLPPEVLAALFGTIPLDMTWVDADDKVRWFSDSPHRIFARSPAIIGRDVRNCHPGASVGRVVAIIDAFRAGTRDREAFWLTMGGKFIHIEYFALRAPDGRYLGTLECSQDLTGRRALSGEKRLADPAT